MSNLIYCGAARVARVFCIVAPVVPALAQTPSFTPLPLLVVTANRVPTLLERTGSSVTIIPSEQVENWGTGGLADVLRGTPGLTVTETGGPGSLSNVTLRGSSPGQTLVLIDGIRIGDAADIGGAVDLGALSAIDVERIEIVRGPQSALYGSDAMGGVINIITRKGARAPKRSVTIEAGRYGTLAASASMTGATDRVSYAFSLTGFHTEGFSRYGYRIPRIVDASPTPLENDKTDKTGGSARITFTPSDSAQVDVGLTRFTNVFRFDNPGAFFPAVPDSLTNKGRQTVTTAFVRASLDPFGGLLKNSITVYTSLTDRFNRLDQSCFDSFFNSYDCNSIFSSRRIGVEYQGTAALGGFGQLTFGAKSERETASTREEYLSAPFTVLTPFTGQQTTNAVFAQHAVTLFDRLDLTIGGRIDVIDQKTVFPTWRATAAYRLEQTGTRFRVAAGTGARAPSLYQRFSIYGVPGLLPEQNVSYEAGVDQSIIDGRVKVSGTLFDARYRNLIDFNPIAPPLGRYYNIGQARIRGAETSVEAILMPQTWRAVATFTAIEAKDEVTQLGLLRRPRQQGSLSLFYTGLPGLELEGRVYAAAHRVDIDNTTFNRVVLPQYGRADVRASYRFNENLTAFARIDNITDARFEEIRDYGVTGRAFYAGLKATW